MISVMTKAGNGKVHSEDAVLCGHRIIVNETLACNVSLNSFIAVADGVGGRLAGEIASSYVLTELAKCSPVELYEQLMAINNQLISISNDSPAMEGMATTLSGIYIANENSFLVHIGNTRIYAMQGRYLKQLTNDHTMYAWLISTGRFEDAENCNRNEIINCFGGGNNKLIDRLCISKIANYKTMLLTSDGIHEYVSIDDLEDILNNDCDDISKCQLIIDKAIAVGSKDDLTVVLVNIE